MTIGSRLQEERDRLNLNQTAMAHAAGTTRRTQSAYETDRTPPKGGYLAKIAALGVDVGYVITGIRAENVAHTPTELGYLRHCRILATRNLHEQGLKGLQFLRESNGIPWTDMPAVYQAMQTGEEPEPTNQGETE